MARIPKSGLVVCTDDSLAAVWGGRNICGKIHRGLYNVPDVRAFASKSSRKKPRKDDQVSKDLSLPQEKLSYNNEVELSTKSSVEVEKNSVSENETQGGRPQTKNHIAPRNSVLLACTVTSGLLFASGLLLRQASHIAFIEGWIGADNCTELSFDFDPWKLELTIGLIVLVTTCRYALLKIWPDFAESSEAANMQVLSSLQPIDYLLVAVLPGMGEELLFRGAMLPLLGLNWVSALAIGVVFGGLHLTGGRKYAFAIWATFVGFIYGLSTIVSSSIVVPMAAHSVNNLVAGILWRSQNDDLVL